MKKRQDSAGIFHPFFKDHGVSLKKHNATTNTNHIINIPNTRPKTLCSRTQPLNLEASERAARSFGATTEAAAGHDDMFTNSSLLSLLRLALLENKVNIINIITEKFIIDKEKSEIYVIKPTSIYKA